MVGGRTPGAGHCDLRRWERAGAWAVGRSKERAFVGSLPRGWEETTLRQLDSALLQHCCGIETGCETTAAADLSVECEESYVQSAAGSNEARAQTSPFPLF
jgi:hypothetical protein